MLQDTDFLQNPPQIIPPFLSTLSGTIREAIHDTVAKLKGVTAVFLTSKLRMAEDMAECLRWNHKLYVKVIALPGF